MSSYVYSALGADEIRLITLLPGNRDDAIWVQFSHHALGKAEDEPPFFPALQEVQATLPADWTVFETLEQKYVYEDSTTGNTTWEHPDADIVSCLTEKVDSGLEYRPRYEALSYSWGSVQLLDTVYVEKYFNIGEELAAALQFLRHDTEARTLWIDALCINQLNTNERSEQVQHMPVIYKQAAAVVAWLGPPSGMSNTALTTLEHLGAQVQIARQGYRLRSPHCEELDWSRDSIALPFHSATWQAILELLQRPYFQRLWIWQELQLARRNAIVQCGDIQIPWQSLRRAVICLFEKHYIPTIELREQLRKTRPLTRECEVDPPNVLFSAISRRKCSEPRDRVYGLLGLASPCFRERIVPRYSASVEEVYKDAFLAHVDLVDRLELIQDFDLGSRQIEGPSWVPDWSMFQKHNSFAGMGQFASGVSASQAKYVPPDVLEVQGVKCSTVLKIGRLIPKEVVEALAVIRESEPEDIRTTTYHPTGENMLGAYVSTLCMNQHSGRNSPRTQRSASLEVLEDSYLQHIAGSKMPSAVVPAQRQDVFWALDRSRGRKLFTTEDGHIGIGPASAQPGDQVYVVLGCYLPLLLRESGSSKLQIVGDSYIHGLSDSIALLGPLPQPWKVKNDYDAAGIWLPLYHNPETGETTLEDPRLGPPPSGWQSAESERKRGDPEVFARFVNARTKEVTNSDPRLLPMACRERGIDLRLLSLV